MKVVMYLLFLSFLSFLSTTTLSARNKNPQKNIHDGFSGFRPIDPLNYTLPVAWFDDLFMYELLRKDTQFVYWDDTCIFNRANQGLYFSDLSNKSILDLLPNENVGIFVQEINNSAEIGFSGVNVLSHKGSNYQIIMDYGKFVTIPIKRITTKVADSTEQIMEVLGYIKVGLGLRIKATVQSKINNVNLGDLFAIGAEASRDKFTGTLALTVLGMEGKDITTLLPLPAAINENTIQAAIVAISTIKSKMYEDNINLTPQIISVRPGSEKSDLSELVYNTEQALTSSSDDEHVISTNLVNTNQAIYKLAPHLFTCPNIE